MLREAFGNEPYDLDDRSGRDDLPTKQANPQEIKNIVRSWFQQFQGRVSEPSSGNKLDEREIAEFCVEMLMGTGESDVPGALYQIDERLREFDVERRAAEALATALYPLVGEV